METISKVNQARAADKASRAGRPTVDDSQKKMTAIVNAARELFCEHGFRPVTMRQVAERADVSTRTLYNQYADKLSLFAACLDFGATNYPPITFSAADDAADVLKDYAVATVDMLCSNTTRQLGMLVYLEGAEEPELAAAADASQDQHMVQPLARYLVAAGLGGVDPIERAKLFIAMAISEWQRGVSFRRSSLSAASVSRHAAKLVTLFLYGARADCKLENRTEDDCLASAIQA